MRGVYLECRKLCNGIINVSENGYVSLLNRYGILNEDIKNSYSVSLESSFKNNVLSFKDNSFIKDIEITKFSKGYKLSFKASKDERFFSFLD